MDAQEALTVAPIISMMMAMDRNKLIGRDGHLPWHIPGELGYFKAVTMGKPVIMGRKTFESMGKPLSGRTNIVVTRNSSWNAEGVLVATRLEQALTLAAEGIAADSPGAYTGNGSGVGLEGVQGSTRRGAHRSTPDSEPVSESDSESGSRRSPDAPELMIIGGAALCRDAMPMTKRLYLTVVDHAFEGDTWLDSFHWNEWQVVSELARDPATTNGLPVTYWVLEKP